MKKHQINPPECQAEDCFLCKNILPDWLEMLRERRDVFSYKKGEVIFEEGTQVRGIYFIIEGKVKVDMSMGDRKYIVRLATNGQILGHRGFGKDDIYPISAVALEPTSVCFISSEFFKTLLKTNSTLLYKLNFFYAEELMATEKRMKHLVYMPVKARIAESLLIMAQVFGLDHSKKLNFTLTRKEIAEMAGTTYESVIRTIAEFVKDGLIETVDKEIRILDVDKLNSCCTESKEELV